MDQHDSSIDATRYYEDFEVGTTRDLGTRTVNRAEIVDFAEQFDPLPMHTDEAAADAASFDGLIASGWHTASLTHRLLVDGLLADVAVVGGMGVDDLSWYEPLEPGDTIRAETTVVEKELWDESRGQVRLRVRTYNQRDVEVMTRTDRVLVERSAGD